MPEISAASRVALTHAFRQNYMANFTRTPPTPQVEIINVRIAATVDVEGSALALTAPGPTGCGAIKGRRPAYFPEFREHRETTVYDRAALAAGTVLQGPAIIEEPESTLVVGPGGACEVLPSGNIIVTIR